MATPAAPHDMEEPSTPISASTLRCVTCGYDLTGATIGGRCPECGADVERSLAAGPRGRQRSPAATASMVTGILSLTVCGVFGPVAMVLYAIAVREIDRGNYPTASRSMAVAGLVMGTISLLLHVVLIPLALLNEL